MHVNRAQWTLRGAKSKLDKFISVCFFRVHAKASIDIYQVWVLIVSIHWKNFGLTVICMNLKNCPLVLRILVITEMVEQQETAREWAQNEMLHPERRANFRIRNRSAGLQLNRRSFVTSLDINWQV